jgi:uncharacterized protein YjbI with pentapeptide repeats
MARWLSGISNSAVYKANLSGADLSRTYFNEGSLDTANLVGANLSAARITNSNLMEANWS